MRSPVDTGGAPGPLAGRRVLLLRPPDAPPDLALAITDLGGAPVEIPLSEFVTVDGIVDRVRAALATGPDHVVFTSARGVRAVADALIGLAPGTMLAAVGTATAAALTDLGFEVGFVPSRSTAAALAAELPFRGANRVVAPLAEQAGPDLVDGLVARGFTVTSLVAYRLRPVDPDPGAWAEAVTAGTVVFTAPSLVDRYRERGGTERPVMISIGPRTTARLADHGWTGVIEAPTHDLQGIVSALVASAHPGS